MTEDQKTELERLAHERWPGRDKYAFEARATGDNRVYFIESSAGEVLLASHTFEGLAAQLKSPLEGQP